jgi:hypothetical protein
VNFVEKEVGQGKEVGSNFVEQVTELTKEANRYKLTAASHARTFLGLTAIASFTP